MGRDGDDLLHQGDVLTGSDEASDVRPGQLASQLDELAWLATRSLNTQGALIVLDQDGELTPSTALMTPAGDDLGCRAMLEFG